MNVYDFDGTIYDGDSSIDFLCFCLKKHKKLFFFLPYQGLFFLLYKLSIISAKKAKEQFFVFLPYITDNDLYDFVNENADKIKEWYKLQKRDDDLIISASPFFLVYYLCKHNGIRNVIATNMDKTTGKIFGENCKGTEKVNRFKKKYSNMEIDNFYTDTNSDLYLAKFAKKAFMVKGNKINEWYAW